MIIYKHKTIENIISYLSEEYSRLDIYIPGIYKEEYYKTFIAGNLILLPLDIEEKVRKNITKDKTQFFEVSLEVIYDRLKNYSNFTDSFNMFSRSIKIMGIESGYMRFYIGEFDEIKIENKETIVISI